MTRFSKAHAYGNDFLYVRSADVEGVPSEGLAALAQQMCDRHTGIGADGLVIYQQPARTDGSTEGPRESLSVLSALSALSASMRLFNADGSRAEVSGNGVRALGALLLRDVSSPSAQIDIVTEGGTKRLMRTEQTARRQVFRADMGKPASLSQIAITVRGETVQAVTLNMGNPQCVLLGALPDEERFRRIGSGLERHPSFPDGTNVEFAHVERPDHVDILIWERGVGPTTSSGTGSCAALVAAAAFGGAARDADVVAPGGSQRVSWTDDGVFLTGWAELICDGEWLRQIPRTR